MDSVDNDNLTIKPGFELTDEEINSINQAKNREWQLDPMDQSHLAKHLFVVLKDGAGEILAQGQLLPLSNTKFCNEVFNLIEIGGIIANEKNKGYGKKLMEGIIEYLKQNNKTGIGFTGKNLIGFYQKCGFSSNSTSLKQFVNYQEFTGDIEDYVFYIDSTDKFMEKVLTNPKETVRLA